MGRPRKVRKRFYKSYYDKNNDDDIPESTLRYNKRPCVNHFDANDSEAGPSNARGFAVLQAEDLVPSTGNVIQTSNSSFSESSGRTNDIVPQARICHSNPGSSSEEDNQSHCSYSLSNNCTSQSNNSTLKGSDNGSGHQPSEARSDFVTEYTDFSDHISSEEEDTRNLSHSHLASDQSSNNIDLSQSRSYEYSYKVRSEEVDRTLFFTEQSSTSQNSNDSCSSDVQSFDGTEILSESSSQEERRQQGFEDLDDCRGSCTQDDSVAPVHGLDEEDSNFVGSAQSSEEHDNRDTGHENDDEISEHMQDPFKRLKEGINGSFSANLNLKVNISVGEILTNSLTLVKKHNWSHVEKADLMKFVNSILNSGNVVPSSRYLLDQYLYSKDDMCYYFFCKSCSLSIGNVPANNPRPAQVQCSNPDCKTLNVLSDLSQATYFVTFYLPSQIEVLLSNLDVRKKIINPTDYVNLPPDNIKSTLYHGDMYRDFANYVLNEIPSDTKVMSFTLSVDSASLCSFSGQKICPAFVVINELPPVLRMGNPLLAGLWFGLNKKKMDLLLPPIVEHITSLSLQGFTLNFLNEVWHSKAFLISCCADSVARCDIQGIHSHRGDYPCSWCLEEGEEFNAVRVFRYSSTRSSPRTTTELREDAQTALDQKLFVRGVKYLSPLAAAPMFHPVKGFVVDQMHAKDEGTTKSFLKAWLGDNGVAPYYIGSPENVKLINEKLKLVKPPKEFRKSIRDLDSLAHWTGRELENWGLFLSIPVLEGILPRKFLKHWALYVQANFILLCCHLPHAAIDVAEKLVEEFCSNVEHLYTVKMMRFNLHILRHFADNARRWGPIFELCAYGFEAGNQKLKKLIHNSNYISSQVCRGFSEENALALLKSNFDTQATRSFSEDIDCSKKSTFNIELPGKIELLFRTKFYCPTNEESWHFDQIGIDKRDVQQFGQVFINGCYYGSNPTQRQNKTDNSFAMLADGSMVCISKILFHTPSNDIWIVAKKVRCVPSCFCPPAVVRLGRKFCFQFTVSSIDEDTELLPASNLYSIAVSMIFNGTHHLSPMPNVLNMY